MSEKKPNTFERNDDFWDIDEMIPKKRFGAVFSTDTDASEIEVHGCEPEKKGQSIPKMSPEVSERLKVARAALKLAEGFNSDVLDELSDAHDALETVEKVNPELSDRLKIARDALKKAEEKHLRYTSSAFGDRKNAHTSAQYDAKPSDEPLFTYSPESNPLIKEVTVKLWPARYSFYEQFRHDAERLFEIRGAPCPAVPFFSFTPQYSQLSAMMVLPLPTR